MNDYIVVKRTTADNARRMLYYLAERFQGAGPQWDKHRLKALQAAVELDDEMLSSDKRAALARERKTA